MKVLAEGQLVECITIPQSDYDHLAAEVSRLTTLTASTAEKLAAAEREETSTLAAVLRSRMAAMTADERVDLLHSIIDGYCKECGFEDPRGNCPCRNDE